MIAASTWDPNLSAVFIGVVLLLALYVEGRLHRAYKELDRKTERFHRDEQRAFKAMLAGRCSVCSERLENTLAWLDEQEAKR